jgi:hypothetical protein
MADVARSLIVDKVSRSSFGAGLACCSREKFAGVFEAGSYSYVIVATSHQQWRHIAVL